MAMSSLSAVAGRAVAIVLLGVLLTPSSRILSHKRTHRRHATCEHHLRSHHADPVERARVLRKAARRQARLEARARAEAVRLAAQALADADDLRVTQAAADPADDDGTIKKRRRSGRRANRFWVPIEKPTVRPGSDFLAHLRLLPEPAGRAPEVCDPPEPRLGSGPCHSIPRPREDTTCPTPRDAGPAA